VLLLLGACLDDACTATAPASAAARAVFLVSTRPPEECSSGDTAGSFRRRRRCLSTENEWPLDVLLGVRDNKGLLKYI